MIRNYAQAIFPLEINTNSIVFSSDIGSIIGLSYGTTHSLELGTINSDTLAGLTASSFYYVKGFTNSGETKVKLFSTKSTSTGSIEVFFNHSPNNDFSNFSDAQYTNFENKVIEVINDAKVTLDICVFYTKSKPIGEAINNAYSRGVVVRFIAGSSSLGDFPKNLDDKIKTLQRKEPKGQMHNKFIVTDMNSSLECQVLISSANFTENNLFDDSNNLLIIQDQTLAKNYTIEFNEMWGGNGASPSSNSKFGINKIDNTSHYFNIRGKSVEVYFSPSDNSETYINKSLESANSTIGFALFTFTRDLFAETLINLNREGVAVYGVIDNKRYFGSEDNNLAKAGISILEFNRKDDMHNKYAFIDAFDSLSDPLVITGSYNWSNSAEEKYDENTIIIHDFKIANEYYEDLNTFTNFGYEKALLENLIVYPNPSSSIINFGNNSNLISDKVNLNIIDIYGKVITSYNVDLANSIDVSNLKAGVYLFKITTKYNFSVKKLIIN